MPPEAQAWQMQDTRQCLNAALQIGPACHAMVHAMFGDHVLIKMRAVQGVMQLKQKYGGIRLEAACQRANHYGTPGYKVVNHSGEGAGSAHPSLGLRCACRHLYRRRPFLPQPWQGAYPLANKMIGAATLDRLRHGAYRVVLDGESYRDPKPMPGRSKPPVEKGWKCDCKNSINHAFFTPSSSP